MFGRPMEAQEMTDLVPIRKGHSTQISLVRLQDLLDAREQVDDTKTTLSTKKARAAAAKKSFELDPLKTMVTIQDLAGDLADIFDGEISLESVPLSQDDVDKLSNEFMHLERLQAQIAALETRYRTLIYAHLDQTSPKIVGRPAAQVPGKVEASGPGPHIVFERRGGNRSNPDLDTEGLREVLPGHLADMIYKSVHHPAMEAYDEPVFDEAEFGRLVDAGLIDLDVVAEFLTPGAWRTPAFYKTLVDGEK
jgi:hypothetical protein